MLDTNDVSTLQIPARQRRSRSRRRPLMKQLASRQAEERQAMERRRVAAQLAWLEKELAAADAADEPVIVCGHHPLLPEEGHHAWNNREILAVIERHPCVPASISAATTMRARKPISNGLPYITFKSVLHRAGRHRLLRGAPFQGPSRHRRPRPREIPRSPAAHGLTKITVRPATGRRGS